MSVLIRFLKGWRCAFFFHKLKVQKHIKGSHPAGDWVATLCCRRCGARFIMSERHQAFLRYDNDPIFKTDIIRMYPTVRMEEL